jgi:hypothetical protein
MIQIVNRILPHSEILSIASFQWFLLRFAFNTVLALD